MVFILSALALANFRPLRFILGAADPEMTAIRPAIPTGIEIVEGCGGTRDGAYASTVAPQAGDVWIECAPAEVACAACSGSGWVAPWELDPSHLEKCPLCGGSGKFGGRAAIEAAGGIWIDHHRAGDYPAGTPAFEASSLGQLCRLLGIVPTPDMVATGEADHNFRSFIRGECSTPKDVAIAWHAARSGVTAAEINEAVAAVEACPVIDGHFDARGNPDLTPALMVRGVRTPGTGGKLGGALFAGIGLVTRPVLNWGAQGVAAQGRNVCVLGDTTAESLALLAKVGAAGTYGAPGRAMGGYIPV